MTLDELKNKHIALVGYGANHKHMARHFEKNGVAFSVVKDWADPAQLVGALDGFDVVFRSPGVAYMSKAVQQAKAKGALIYSQTRLFFDLCPAKIIGVTGTKGKGTTASLIFEILKRNFQLKPVPKVYLAGNIGHDPFEFIDALSADDLVILELSSFQLQDMDKSPEIAVVLEISPEHLDYHLSFAEYVEAKKQIVSHQSKENIAVLNYDSETSRSFAETTPAKIFWASTRQEVAPGCFVRGDKIVLRPTPGNENESVIMNLSDITIPGAFNLANITAAITAAAAAGVSDFAAAAAAAGAFKGLLHRLEYAAESDGIKYYNDSASTTPEAAIAAISSFDKPLILIIGGSEKKADYSELAKKIAESRVKAILAVGATGPAIAKMARAAGYAGKVYDDGLSNMEKIVSRAREIAEAGDIVLLSPASASFDMFSSYAHRGELFKKYVKKQQ